MPRETGITIPASAIAGDWVLSYSRVGKTAAVAVVANERGTRPVVAVKDGPKDLDAIRKAASPDERAELGTWITLMAPDMDQRVTLYGGEGPLALTAYRLLTIARHEQPAINKALESITRTARRFARTIQSM